ncbi:MAG: transporter, partial [Planctomycetaceae bacterium]
MASPCPLDRHRVSRGLPVFSGLLTICLMGPLAAQAGEPSWLPTTAGDRVFATEPSEAGPVPLFEEGERGDAEGAEDEIETDRDSFTPATTTAGRGRTIFETAYTFIDNRRTYDTHSYPEFLVRLGVSDRLEARLAWNAEVGGEGNTVSSEGGDEDFESPHIVRETQISYGLKYVVQRQEGWLPDLAVITTGQTPTSGPETATTFVGTVVTGWTLANRSKIDAAIRYSPDVVEHDHHNLWAPSLVWKVPVWSRVNVHAEYFGIFTTGRRDNTNAQYLSPGIHFLLTPDLEVGVRGGWGLNDDSARFFVN